MRAIAISLALTLAVIVSAADKKTAKDEVLVSFSGAVSSMTKKEIVIEPEPENQMHFVRSKRTRFVAGNKTFEPVTLAKGDIITIQATRKLNGDLEAVIVSRGVPPAKVP